MKTMLLAAAGLSLVASTVAYAGDGAAANTFFAQSPVVGAQAPMQDVPAIAEQKREQSQTYSQSAHSPWLFPPIGKYLDQQAGG